MKKRPVTRNDDDGDDNNNNNNKEGQIPDWLTTGTTILVPKNGNTERPKKCRPITCLPTIYETIMSIISK